MEKPKLEIQYLGGGEIWQTRRIETLERIVSPKGLSIWKTYRLGRNSRCEICIPWIGSLLSNFQATFVRDAQSTDHWVIDGLPLKPSTNGIRVNGQKIKSRAALTHGSVIGLAYGLRAIYLNKLVLMDDNLSEITLTNANEPTDSDSQA